MNKRLTQTAAPLALSLACALALTQANAEPTATEAPDPRFERLTRNLLDQEQRLQQLQEEMRALRGENELLQHRLAQFESEQKATLTAFEARLGKLELHGALPPPPAPAQVESAVQTAKPTTSPAAEAESVAAPPPAGNAQPPAAPASAEDSLPPVGGGVDSNQDLSRSLATATDAAQPPTPPPAPAVPAETVDPAYQAAFRLLQNGHYQKAQQALLEYKQSHPGSAYADNAQFWLGEAYYAQQDYVGAVREYKQLLDRYPSSEKRPQALLKMAYSYEAMKDKTAMRQMLEHVRRVYPDSSSARLAEARLRALSAEQ